MSRPRFALQRRIVLAGGVVAVAAWVAGAPHLASLWRSPPGFQDIPGLAPFRTLDAAGALSAGAGLFAGLDDPGPRDAAQEARIAAVRADPCTALFGRDRDARLPIAIFSDFNCPNCRIMDATLESIRDARPDAVRIVRHELPLLGAASTVASKAVLAADLQGGHAEMHARLMRSRMVTDLNLVMAIAESVGLDGQRLVADMQSPDIAAALDRSRAIASVFGFWGTPATVIGRAVFLGQLPAADVARIVDAEIAALPMDCARG